MPPDPGPPLEEVPDAVSSSPPAFFLVALGSLPEILGRVFQSLHHVLLALGFLEGPATLGETVILLLRFP